MKIRYYINLKSHMDNRYYIHSEHCPLIPLAEKRLYLGSFESPGDAVMVTMKYFSNVACCRFCQSEFVRKATPPIKRELTVNSDFILSGTIKSTPDYMLVCCIN